MEELFQVGVILSGHLPLVFNSVAQESKAVLDVLVADPNRKGTNLGISCKMRRTLNDIERTGRVTIELSNSAGKFWQALNAINLNQEIYRNDPELVGQTIIMLVKSWHDAVSLVRGGNVDLNKSYYLVLSWNKVGDYQLHQFPLTLPTSSIL